MAASGRTYRLEVQGELGDMSGRSFPEMRIFHRGGNTLLVGRVRDQAELSEIIERCSELALKVLSVIALDDGEASGSRSPG